MCLMCIHTMHSVTQCSLGLENCLMWLGITVQIYSYHYPKHFKLNHEIFIASYIILTYNTFHSKSYFFTVVGRTIFEPCDHPNQCNGTKDANVCKGFGSKTLCYCNHGYLELGGKCIQGNNYFFSDNTYSFFRKSQNLFIK